MSRPKLSITCFRCLGECANDSHAAVPECHLSKADNLMYFRWHIGTPRKKNLRFIPMAMIVHAPVPGANLLYLKMNYSIIIGETPCAEFESPLTFPELSHRLSTNRPSIHCVYDPVVRLPPISVRASDSLEFQLSAPVNDIGFVGFFFPESC